MNRRNVLASLLTIPAVAVAKAAEGAMPHETSGHPHVAHHHGAGEPPEATETTPGIVSTDGQTFGGTKTFAEGLVVGGGASISQTQGGTLDAPTAETALKLIPRDPAIGAYKVVLAPAKFNGVLDEVLNIGYNVDQENRSEPSMYLSFNHDYFDGVTHRMETNFVYSSPGSAVNIQWFSCQFDRATQFCASLWVWRDAPGSPAYFALGEDSTKTTQVQWFTGQMVVKPRNYQIMADDGLEIIATSNGYLQFAGRAVALQGDNEVSLRGNVISFETSDAVFKCCVETLFASGVLAWNPGGVRNLFMSPSGTQFGAVQDYGGGVGVLGIADAATVPNANPAGGGVLYSEDGALKWRGSNGTITVIAPA